MSDPFAGVAATATEAFNAAETSAPAPSADQQATPPSAAADPSATESTPAQLQIPDDYKVTVQVGGQPVEMTFKELRESGMRHADYTRKTQELAAHRQELLGARDEIQRTYAEHAQLVNFLRDPNRILAYAAQLQQQSQAQVQADPNADPNDVISRAEALRLAQEHAQRQAVEAERRLEEKFNEKLLSFQLERETESARGQINTLIQSFTSKHPELKAIRHVDRVLREEVKARQPQTMDEVRQYLAEAVEGQLQELNAVWEGRQKTQAARAAKLQNAIEPPGGAPVQPSTKKFSLKSGSQGHKDLLKSAEETLLAGLKR